MLRLIAWLVRAEAMSWPQFWVGARRYLLRVDKLVALAERGETTALRAHLWAIVTAASTPPRGAAVGFAAAQTPRA